MTHKQDSGRSSLTPVLYFGAAAALALAVGGCTSGMRRALGVEKVAPDEFKVVTQAPLVIPPDFNLRPPEPGEARPQDLPPAVAARKALLGPEFSAPMSPGERGLVTQAMNASGGIEPGVRNTVDLEGADLSKKPEGFANKVMFWNDGDKKDKDGSASPAPVDPQSEADKLAQQAGDTATGGKPVVIERKKTGVRLPGL